MKRGNVAYADDIVDAISDLVRARLGVLIPQAVANEFSRAQPKDVDCDSPPMSLRCAFLQAIAEAVLCAARSRSAQQVAEAVAQRLVANDGVECWLAGRAERTRSVQREFDVWAAGQRDRQARRARLAQIRRGSVAERPELTVERAKLRRRIARVRLPSLNS
jgi:hypothetical protein